MSTPVRQSISTALAILSVSPVVAVDLSPANSVAVARPAMRRPVQTQTGFARIRLLRSKNRVAIAVDLPGKVERVSQNFSDSSWIGEISTSKTPRLIQGQNSLVIPDLGNAEATLTLNSRGVVLNVVRMDGRRMNQAEVSNTDSGLLFSFSQQSLPTAEMGYRDPVFPRRLPQQSFAPILQRRAVAPAVGDIAVGTTAIPNPNLLNITGPNISVKYRQTNARQAFEDLVSRGGYGFVWVPVDPHFLPASIPAVAPISVDSPIPDNSLNLSDSVLQGQLPGFGTTAPVSDGTSSPDSTRYVNMTMTNQPYSRVFNALLMVTQMQAKLEDGLVYVGPQVRNTIIKSRFARTYRLNQVSARQAAEYLANLGALINQTAESTTSTSSESGSSSGLVSTDTADNASSESTTTRTSTSTSSFGAQSGPLLGLTGTTDNRLQSITLIGSQELLSVAEQFIKKIDLRQRQVALSIKVLDITLDNVKTTENSFAFRSGNSFIVSDRGELITAFGESLPPNDNSFNVMAGGADSVKPQYVEVDESVVRRLEPTSPFPAQMNPMDTVVNVGTEDSPIYQRRPVYNRDTLYDLVRSKIESSSAKVIVSPTLILSEDSQVIPGGSSEVQSDGTSGSIGRESANQAFVESGIQEITSYTVIAGVNGAPNTCQPEFETAGLNLGAMVHKIDDNGFVSFVLSPQISAVVGAGEEIPGCGPIKRLIRRRLDTGHLRVRDGQTLILTGVISEYDQEQVRKWPLLGDIPIVGQFFRSRNGTRQKRELVIMVTPQIIDDDQGGIYGYGYTPSKQASTYLRD